jgi:hypothetical protein
MYRTHLTLAWLIVALFLVSILAQDVQNARELPPELNGLPGTAELFENIEQLNAFVDKSAVEAENFRQSFLTEEEFEPMAVTLARLVQKFRDVHARQVIKSAGSKPTFQVSNLDFVNGFRGVVNPIDGDEVYRAFAGKWHGYWREEIVRHHWSELIKSKDGISYQANAKLESPQFSVSSYQYAWIGDGYGLNLVASENNSNETRHYLLGYVEHLKGGDFSQVTARRPHVGIFINKGKLIWVTAKEVFFEESFSDSYSIIGFNYSTISGELVANEGFQTLYQRGSPGASPRELPKFRSFKVSIREQRQSVQN